MNSGILLPEQSELGDRLQQSILRSIKLATDICGELVQCIRFNVDSVVNKDVLDPFYGYPYMI